MDKIVFISDYFIDEILGGAEKCNDVFIKKISPQYKVEKIKSSQVTPDFISKNKNK